MSPLSTACLVSFKRARHISVVVIDHVTIINWLFIFVQKGHNYLSSNYRSCHCYQLLVSFIQRDRMYHCSNYRLLLSTAYAILFKRAINMTVAYCSYCIDHITYKNCMLNFIPESLKLEDIAGGWSVWTSLQYIKYSSDVLHPSDAESKTAYNSVLRNALYGILTELNKSMKLVKLL